MASGWLAAKAGETRRPPVEPWSLAAYGVALGVWLLVALGFAITRFDSDGSLTRFHVQVAALVLPAMGLRYLSFPRLATAIEATRVALSEMYGTNQPIMEQYFNFWARLLRGDLGEAVLQLKRQPGKGLAVGGVKLPQALAELGLIDEYEFVVHPRLAGHGPTLFAGLPKHIDLKLVSRLEFRSGAVALRYELATAGSAKTRGIDEPTA